MVGEFIFHTDLEIIRVLRTMTQQPWQLRYAKNSRAAPMSSFFKCGSAEVMQASCLCEE